MVSPEINIEHQMSNNECRFTSLFDIRHSVFDINLSPPHLLRRLSSKAVAHSERRLFTGFTSAALMDWKLMVINATTIAARVASANIHQSTATR